MSTIPAGTERIRPFVPAKDFDRSKRFYEAIGFEKVLDGEVAIFNAASGGFILQRYYQKEWAENFMMQLTKQEIEDMVSQNAIPSKGHLGGALPYAFTEHGVLMLANVLKSERAVQVSIKIIELFVKLREILVTHTELKLEIEKIRKKLDNHDKNIEVVFQYLDELIEKKEKPRKKIAGISMMSMKKIRKTIDSVRVRNSLMLSVIPRSTIAMRSADIW